ncbi:hypothetical protein KAR91_48930 [Candidatus Pacearchaeota archaeon]|nr:hypothetical protein [Candidatus Pacearchaeota archaeon]
MAIFLNFKNFTISDKAGSNGTAAISADALVDLCTAAQLNRFAKNIIGKEFEKGTTKRDGCKVLFTAMVDKVGGKAPVTDKTGKKDSKPAASPKPPKPPKPSTPLPSDSSKKKAVVKPKAKTVGYEKAVVAVNTKYANEVEALKTVVKYVGNQSQVLARIKNVRDQKLEALKKVKAYL